MNGNPNLGNFTLCGTTSFHTTKIRRGFCEENNFAKKTKTRKYEKIIPGPQHEHLKHRLVKQLTSSFYFVLYLTLYIFFAQTIRNDIRELYTSLFHFHMSASIRSLIYNIIISSII